MRFAGSGTLRFSSPMPRWIQLSLPELSDGSWDFNVLPPLQLLLTVNQVVDPIDQHLDQLHLKKRTPPRSFLALCNERESEQNRPSPRICPDGRCWKCQRCLRWPPCPLHPCLSSAAAGGRGFWRNVGPADGFLSVVIYLTYSKMPLKDPNPTV